MFRCGVAITLLVLAASPTAGAGAAAQEPADAPRAILLVHSDPAGAVVQVEGLDHAGVTPDTLALGSGDWTIRLVLERFQPLTHSLSVATGTVTTLDFILLQTPPEIPAPEMIGLVYEPEVLRRDPMEAYQVRRKYYALVETFTVFPLAQGIIAKAAFDEDTSFPADEFLYAGLVLVAASTVMAETMFKKAQRDIEQHNIMAETRNGEAAARNGEVDRAVSAWHDEAVAAWQEAVVGRGRVLATVIWPPAPSRWRP